MLAPMTSTTMTTLFTDWQAAANHAPGTRYRNEGLWRCHCQPLANVFPDGLDYRSIEDIERSMQHAGLSLDTIRTVHSMLTALCEWAVRRGYMPDNPTDKVVHPQWKRDGEGVQVPSREEVAALMDAADLQFRTFLILACALGTRRAETCALRWSCIDFDDKSVLIDASLDCVPGHDGELRATKTGATATLSIGDKTAAALWEWKSDRQERLRLAGAPPLNPNSFVFALDPRGDRPWHPQAATNRFQTVRRKAGVGRHVTLKSLRHFHATQLISNGVDIRTVAGRLRHANPGTTLTYYAKFDKRADRAAAALFDEL